MWCLSNYQPPISSASCINPYTNNWLILELSFISQLGKPSQAKVDISLKIWKAWLRISDITTWSCSLERLANCTHTCSYNSVLLRDCTPHATISTSLLDNGSCANIVTNVYKCRSAGKNNGKHITGDISQNCVPSVLPPGSKRQTQKSTRNQVKLVKGPLLGFWTIPM